jgi:hypothetical protein
MVDHKTIEQVATALGNADVGHSLELTKLVDGVHTYILKMDSKSEEFVDSEEDTALDQAYARIREIKHRKQAEAVVTALASTLIVSSDESSAAIHAHTVRKAVLREEASGMLGLAEELRDAMRFIERVAEKENLLNGKS